MRRVTRCDCAGEQQSGQRLTQSHVPRRYEHCDFESFDVLKDPLTGQPNNYLGTAKLHAQRFVEEYPLDVGLLFSGPAGVGKTHLAVAVIRELMLRKGIPCLFCDFRDLLKTIQDSYNPVSQGSELRVLQPVLDSEVLLLDGLVALNPSEWVKDTLGHIINSRYNQKNVTLITTTLSFSNPSAQREIRMPSGETISNREKALDLYGVTLQSRLYEMCKVIRIEADDFRRRIKPGERPFLAGIDA